MLASIVDPAERTTLVDVPAGGDGTGTRSDLVFDVRLQGEKETVFFVP